METASPASMVAAAGNDGADASVAARLKARALNENAWGGILAFHFEVSLCGSLFGQEAELRLEELRLRKRAKGKGFGRSVEPSQALQVVCEASCTQV